MCPVLILTVAFWLMTGFMQLVSALQIRFESTTPGVEQIKMKEQDLHFVDFVVDQLPSLAILQQSRFHLNAQINDQTVASLHSGPFPPNGTIRSDLVSRLSAKPTIFDQQLLDLQLHQLQPSSLGKYRASLRLQGQNIGYTQMSLRLDQFDRHTDRLLDRAVSKSADVLVISGNENSVWSKVFTVCVIILVSLNNINMGCALDMDAVKSSLARPIGPSIGLFSQYLFMPLLAYLIGYWILADIPYLRLSLFIFGCSPAGAASNMWTVLLRGNLNLSITMTLLSTFMAMFLMPAWLFTLGRHTFQNNQLQVPYRSIVTTLVSMALFLAAGLLVQRLFPKVAKVCRRILAPVSGILIAFIVVFGSCVYWHLFRLMSWQVLISAAANVWCGFLLGAIFARLCGRSRPDTIAIAIETGIQNTGISFIILRVALVSPFHDFAMTIPVAASMMSALPLAAMYICMRCCGTTGNDRKSESKQQVYCNDNSETQPACGSTTEKTCSPITPSRTAQMDESGEHVSNSNEAKLTGSVSVLRNFTNVNNLNSV